MRILKGLSSRLLPCGCIAGVYETYEGEIVTIIDAPDSRCSDRDHTEGNIVPNFVPPPDNSNRVSAND